MGFEYGDWGVFVGGGALVRKRLMAEQAPNDTEPKLVGSENGRASGVRSSGVAVERPKRQCDLSVKDRR